MILRSLAKDSIRANPVQAKSALRSVMPNLSRQFLEFTTNTPIRQGSQRRVAELLFDQLDVDPTSGTC